LQPTTIGRFHFGATPYSTIIIGVWGSRQRKIKATYQFFLYTSLGFVFMLLAILLILLQTGTTNLQILLTTKFSERAPNLSMDCFFRLFRRQSAYGTSSYLDSSSLVGILLKLGTYRFLRFSIPMFPEATLCFTPCIYTLTYMNLVTIDMFSLNIQGIGVSILLMLSHGLISSALFLCVAALLGISYLNRAFQRNSLVATLASLGMILGATYSFWLYNRAVFGNLKPDFLYKFSNPNGREVSIFIPFH
ncbi:NADH-ubiquinone oxidoreductase chain 4, partial [Camellia lanceoleosa]